MTSSEQVIDACGITYRQLDYWVRKGYLTPRAGATGSGHLRDFADDELAVAARMARLIDRGFTPWAAAKIARTGAGRVTLGRGLTLEITDNGEEGT